MAVETDMTAERLAVNGTLHDWQAKGETGLAYLQLSTQIIGRQKNRVELGQLRKRDGSKLAYKRENTRARTDALGQTGRVSRLGFADGFRRCAVSKNAFALKLFWIDDPNLGDLPARKLLKEFKSNAASADDQDFQPGQASDGVGWSAYKLRQARTCSSGRF